MFIQFIVLNLLGAKWQKRRKILTPAFHFSILKKFTEIIVENSETLVEELKKECNKPKTDVTPYFSKSTLKIICGK